MTQTKEVTGRNIVQRLLAVQAGVAGLKATSKDQYGKPSIGIEDVEEALRPLLAKEGVWIRYSPVRQRGRVRVYTFEEKTSKGTNEVWRSELDITFVNADDPSDIEGPITWTDIGSNPAASYSFLRKSFLKAHFHLADEEDNKVPARTNGSAQREETASPRLDWKKVACPACGTLGTVRRKSDGTNFCSKRDGGCGADLEPDAVEKAKALAMSGAAERAQHVADHLEAEGVDPDLSGWEAEAARAVDAATNGQAALPMGGAR